MTAAKRPTVDALVLAMARMMVAECTDCRGYGIHRASWNPDTKEYERLLCETCGPVRKALADAETS